MIAMESEPDNGVQLEKLCARMMQALSWAPDLAPDWASFRVLFHADAILVPAARPAVPITVESFIERMTAQRDNGSLIHFSEAQLSLRAEVFGNVATVFQAYKTVVNNGTPGFGTSAMVWVADQGNWHCISMAWDVETPDKRIAQKYLG